MDFEKIKNFIKTQKIPAYRLAQIRSAVYEQGITSWEAATNLPLDLREKLSVKPVLIQASKIDKVFKVLLELEDGFQIESVLMKPGKTWSICVSSQVGCPLGCAFCATGKMGFKRNLTTEEICDQALFWSDFLKEKKLGARISNIVFMGMGEPLLNYQNVVAAVKELSNNDYLAIGQRHISISTSGIADRFINLAQDLPQVNLALSLHNADNEERSKLMPVNKKYDLDIIKEKLEEYLARTSREVFLEYTVIDGVNNGLHHLRKLGKWISSIKDNYLLHINLIACNKAVGKAVETDEFVVRKFSQALTKMHIKNSIRKSLGSDISAACGQLAVNNRRKK